MRNLTFICLNALILFITALPISAQNTNGAIAGNWLGTLDLGAAKLRLLLKIKENDGNLKATLNSLDQDGKDSPLDSINFANKKLSFTDAKYGVSYEGTLNEEGGEIIGTFRQGTNSLPLNFKSTTEEFGIKRPQTPQKPYPYEEEKVSYKNAKDDVKLAGTLTLPRGAGRFPAVVLITGSGAQDRDETIFGHRPFLVLADYLTRKGIAVLRVDDRGIGGSDPGSPRATTENYVGDVLSGVEYLKTRKEINQKQIGLIGHSEGGIIAPLAAARSKDVAFIVMLAGSGQSGEEVIFSQIAAVLKANGVKPEEIAQKVDLQKSLFAIIKSEPDDKIAVQKINEMFTQRESKMNEQELKMFAPVKTQIKAGISGLLSPWYRYFLAYNPRPTLEKVRVPVLALNGENDTQVSSKENLPLIAAALETGENEDFTIKSFPKLNHLFQTSQTGLPDEYGEIEETIAPVVLETISDWILKELLSSKRELKQIEQ